MSPAKKKTSTAPKPAKAAKATGAKKGAKAGAKRSTNKSANKSAKVRKRRAPTRRRRTGAGMTLKQRALWLGSAAFFLASLGVLALVLVFSYYGRDLPTVDALKDYHPPQVTRIVDRNGQLLSEVFEERRSVVPMDKVPRVLALAVLAAEDADFYRHRGLDYAGILRALARDVMSGRPTQGASTITQQIVKNVLLTPERTIERKVRELILARRLEQELTKDEILGLYLNHIYFGHGRYGVQEASLFYFGKDVSEMTLAEASLIAGIPQAPARLSPINHPEAAKQRQTYVLNQLAGKRQQYWPDLQAEDIEAARTAEVTLVGSRSLESGAPEVMPLAKAALAKTVGEVLADKGGFTVTTSIDLELQRRVRKALRKGLIAIDKRRGFQGPLRVPKKKPKLDKVRRLRMGRTYDARVIGTREQGGVIRLDIGGHQAEAKLADASRFNPDKLPVRRFAPDGALTRASILALPKRGPAQAKLELGPQGAVVVIDPRTREVLALVGGDTANYGFNRATQAIRQPGSTFKPIAYGLAIESGKFTAASMVLDAPEVFDEWRPSNYETWNYAGAVRLREALARSINLVAVRVTDDLTPAAVAQFARQLGITTELEESLALSLGASGVRPLQLVNAYATFAAAGHYAPPVLVRKVSKPDGTEVPTQDADSERDVMQPASAFVITSMLQSVVKSGTAQRARRLRRPAAGKTGTSNKARDAWFVGFTPDVVAGVWVGFDDHRPLGRGESGSKSALPIWIDVMKEVLGDRPATSFPEPEGITRVDIDPKTGLLAYEGQEDAMEEVFVEGSEPAETATPPDVLDESSFLMEQL